MRISGRPVIVTLNRDPITRKIKALSPFPVRPKNRWNTRFPTWPSFGIQRKFLIQVPWLSSNGRLRIIGALEPKNIFRWPFFPLPSIDSNQRMGPIDRDKSPSPPVHPRKESTALDMRPEHKLIRPHRSNYHLIPRCAAL